MLALAVAALITVGSGVLVLSAVGLCVMREPADQLHYVGPAATVAPVAIALAVVLEDGFTSQAGLKALCVATAIVCTSPMVSYATLRAIRTRQTGAPDAEQEALVQR